MVVDSSDYVRRRKLTVIRNGNDAADKSKFRALTRFDSYDASIRVATGPECNDSCKPAKPHNIFSVLKYKADKVPHF